MSPRIWKRLALALCIAVVGAAIYLGWAKDFIAMDRCLDAGGVYEKDQGICQDSGDG